MRTVKLAALIASTVALSSTLALAGPSPKSHGPNAASSKSTGPKTTKAQGASSSKAKSPAATSTTTKPGNGNAKKTQPGTTTASNTTTPAPGSPATSPTSPTTTPTTWKPTNAVSEKLVTKPNLLQKAKNALPPNTDLNLATAGFKNFGQFNAAVNVSQNLHIDFAQLKLKMTGIPLTGTPPGGNTQTPTTLSLGQAIHELRGDVNAPVEAEKATRQAELEGGAPTTTATSSSKTKKS